jgi:chemotaxis protein MotB
MRSDAQRRAAPRAAAAATPVDHAMSKAEQVTIIRKRHEDGHDDHHGGAWKVAYADFVTAMMAFFLLLWLLGATNEQQRKGIADYFSPTVSVMSMSSGGDGLLGGTTIATASGAMQANGAVQLTLPIAPAAADSNQDTDVSPPPQPQPQPDDAAVAAAAEAAAANAAANEQKAFDTAQQALRQAIDASPDLKDLAQNILVDQTPEGLRIQIVDQQQYSMFPSGSAEMTARTRQLVALVAKAVAPLPNRIAVRGHTDARPFAAGARGDNWTLSGERANATRRALADAGLAADRFAEIAGRADTEPFIASDPNDPRNRRISILLLRTGTTPSSASEPGHAEAAAPRKRA